MAITAKDVMELRQKTGLGMMECKQALAETEGDLQKAVDLLRQRGLARMDGRTDRASAEGRITTVANGDQSKAVIVEVNAETDFTAGTEEFKQMLQAVASEALKQGPGEVKKTDAMQAAIDDVRIKTKENVQFARGRVMGGAGRKVGAYVHFTGKIGSMVEVEGDASGPLLSDLCMHVTAVTPTPLGVADEEIPAEVLAKEREIAKAQAIEQGKPANIAEKMVEGKIRKFLEDHVLVKQVFVKDDKKKVKDILPAGVTVKGFVRYTLGGN